MNYDNYYKNGGMTKEESVSAIALRIGARKEAVAKFVEKNNIDTNKLNSDLKSGQVYFLDVITAIVGKPDNKYEKQIVKKYSIKMAMGGKTQGYDAREDERLGMEYGKMSGKDFDGSHAMREHSRRDDARFEERMAKGGELTYDDFMVGDFYSNSSEGGKFKFVGKDESGRLRFEDSKGINRIFSPKRMNKYADGGMMARGGKIDEKEKLSNISYQLINTEDSFKKNNPEAYSRMKDEYKAQFIKVYGKDEYAKRHIMADGGMMARGGYVSKGELVWKKLTKSERMKFLHENFTPQITPRSQETLVGKDYNFLPKNVKIVMESKYANVEDYADGGRIKEEDNYLLGYEPYFEKHVRIASIDRENKIVRPTHGYFPKHPMSKKAINWAKKHGYDYMADDKKYDDGGETERDKNGMLYALQEHISSGEIASKTNASKYADIDEIRSKAIQYYMENGDKPYSYAELESVLKKFDHTKYADGGETERKAEAIKTAVEIATMAYKNGVRAYDMDFEDFSERIFYISKISYPIVDLRLAYNALLNSGYKNGGMMADGGAIEDQYVGRTAEDIWNNLTQRQRTHFLVDHRRSIIGNDPKEPYYENSNKNWNDLDYEVSQGFHHHVINGQYAKGGTIEDQYVGRTAEDIWDSLSQNQRSHFIYDHAIEIEMLNDKNYDDSSNEFPKEMTSEFVKKAYRSDWKDLDEVVQNRFANHVRKGEYAKGGEISEQNKINKKVLALVQKANIDSKLEFGQLVVSALTDANAHSEVRKFISIIEKKPEWAEKPKEIDMNLPREEFKKQRAKTVYGSKYYDANEEINDLGIKIANMFAWDFEGILDSLIFASKMSGRNDVAQVLEKLNTDDDKQDVTKNKWEYTDKDEIEYVVVKDKFGEELKFDGKDVISGVHDLLEKGGKLTEIGKYYSKNDVVSVFVNGKNILDKNTVSGVWIKKDAEPNKDKFNKDEFNEGIVTDLYENINGKKIRTQNQRSIKEAIESANENSKYYKGYAEVYIGAIYVGSSRNGVFKYSSKYKGNKYDQDGMKADGGDVSEMKIGQTTIRKGYNGWVGKTMVDNFKGYDWDITTIKNSRGDLTTTAQGGKSEDKGGYKMFTFMVYQDPSIRLKTSRPARVNEKVVSEQHAEAMKDWREMQDEISEKVDQIQGKKKMADGGAIGFDALAKKVAKNYEGDKVKKQYQDEYGKTYDKKEAEEVGKKVAGKVYGQQQAKKKMAKGGKVAKKSGSPANRSQSKMTLISRKASEIRKANEPWKDAFNRAKAIIG